LSCHRDPETIARQEALAKKEKMDKDDEERLLEFIEKQVTPGPSARYNGEVM
jgi:DNA/RNA-binding protein KIN17